MVLTAALAACSRDGRQAAQVTLPADAGPVAIVHALSPSDASAHDEAVADSASLAIADDASRASSDSPKRPPADLNVIVISIDSLRADMPWAGYPRPIAPRLTALEAKSVSYTHAYAISSYTSMSLGGLLGGKLPGEMKRDGYFFGTYPKEDLMFPELLQAASIHTLAAHAHAYFKDATFRQGFDRWEVVPDITFKNTTDENVTSPKQEALAEKLLSEKACETGRFFAWFHFMDPHDMYQGHEPEIAAWGRTMRDRYDGEVTFTDKYVGKLVDFIESKPWGPHTAIIVTADHGEAFGEHKQYVHGFELWENLVHVPLFFYVPGAPPRRIAAPRSAIDLAPTILDLFALPQEPTFEGKSLVPELYGAEAAPRDVVLDLPMTSDSDRRRGLIHGKYKLIAFGEDKSFSVFDLESDPGEEKPITKGDAYDDMLGRYKALSKSIHDVMPYSCRETCLNGAYLKKDAGTSPP